MLRRLRALPKEARKHIGDEFNKGADELVALMKRRAPKKSGRLRASIMWKYANSGGANSGDLRIKVVAGGGRTRVRYAHIVEFGAAPHIAGGRFKGAQHPGVRAQPFFYVTYRQKKRSLKSRRRRAFKKAIAASRGA